MEDKCADCRFFRWTQGLDNVGQCHRKPPKVVLVGNLLSRELLINLFVHVTEDNFCGEFQPRLNAIVE
jgi:hypothetical protein